MAAEAVLHDLGVIPITSSDAQGMGRAGETVRAHLCDGVRDEGRAVPAGDGRRRQRARPPLPRQAHDQPGAGARHRARGRIARAGQARGHRVVAARDVRCQAVPCAEGGPAGVGCRGDPNASLDSANHWCWVPQFGGSGAAPADLSVVFVNAAAAAADSDIIATRRRRVAVHGTRDIGLATMLCGNDRLVPSRSARTPAA